MHEDNESRISFPPYGVLSHDEAGALNEFDATHLSHVIPIDWMPLQNDPGSTREEKWQHWFHGVIEQLNEVLWPNWNPSSCKWEPAASLPSIETLTRADFMVFTAMEKERVNRGLDQAPNSPNRGPELRSHRQLYIIEDGRPLEGQPAIDVMSYYGAYDSKFPKELAAYVETLYFNAMQHKVHYLPFQVKALLQRPRPFQTALLLGYPFFSNELTHLGLTPSACSGHCLQALTAMGGVYEYFHMSGIAMDAGTRASMQQCGVDVGDRRVMAGVHYPSDNLCSWIILMNLADRVYRDPSVKCWLWRAITKHSWVYASIEKAGQAGHQPALEHLRSLAPVNCPCD